MWLARLFGTKAETVYEESSVPPVDMPMPPDDSLTQTSVTSMTSIRRHRSGDTPKSGFDPYNSGAFERSRTWEKVTKR